MDTPLLDINDIGLRLYQSGELQLVSSGFATHDNKETWFGSDAETRVKLLPTKTEYHFWDRLNMDSLEQASSIARSQADLAYRHLESIAAATGSSAPLVITVAGDLEQKQLALLLGMLQRLQWPVLAVVDAAVAACDRPAPGRQLFQLELHLHRVVLSQLIQGHQLQLESTATLREIGMMRLREAWSDAITRSFVRATRFDPQHDAMVEQQLYDHLDQWLDHLKSSTEMEITLSRGDDRFTTYLERETILRAARPQYRLLLDFLNQQLPENQPVTLAISPRLARLPGMLPLLESLRDCEIQITSERALFETVGSLTKELSDPQQQVPYIVQKPWFSQDEATQHGTGLEQYQRKAPTHVLFRATAWPLGRNFTIGTASGVDGNFLRLESGNDNIREFHCRLELEGSRIYLENTGEGLTRLNGKRLSERTEVSVGDRIGIGDQDGELLLIAIAGDPNGT